MESHGATEQQQPALPQLKQTAFSGQNSVNPHFKDKDTKAQKG